MAARQSAVAPWLPVKYFPPTKCCGPVSGGPVAARPTKCCGPVAARPVAVPVSKKLPMKMHFLVPPLILAVALLNSSAFAEKAPLSVDQLKTHADAIVVATIKDIRIESEPSRFEPGFGNSDWGIYLTLTVKQVEEGSISDENIEARCFRIRSRGSFTEDLTPSGHYPIPKIGTSVRTYLEKEGNLWRVVLPNGITSVSGWPVGSLEDAAEVAQLRSLAFTFLLPMEIWLLLVVVGIPMLLTMPRFMRWAKRHRPASGDTASGDTASGDTAR